MDVGDAKRATDADDSEDDDVVIFDTCETCGGCCEDCTEEADCQTCIDNRHQADGEDDDEDCK